MEIIDRSKASILIKNALFAVTFLCAFVTTLQAGDFPPAAEETGSDAISATDPLITRWATNVTVQRGPTNANFPEGALTTFGEAANAVGPANAQDSQNFHVISLGDGGMATATFDTPISDKANSPDIVVFENSFSDEFLELAFVEVSSDGINFFRFPAVSQTQTATQVGSFGSLDPTNLRNLAGKYRAGFGTPFDLAELENVSPLLDINAVTHVRVVDVVGSVNSTLGSLDSLGNLVNDPFTTDFPSGGFDLDAIGVINDINLPFVSILTFEMQGRTFVVRRSNSLSNQLVSINASSDLTSLTSIITFDEAGALTILSQDYDVEILSEGEEIRVTPKNAETTKHFFTVTSIPTT